jgi:MoaA/NifB/PqqE/SkfB family radical SAM enzyme
MIAEPFSHLTAMPRNPAVSRCGHPWQTVLISNEGQVLPCGHGSKPVGDLRSERFDSIWNGQVMQEVRHCVSNGVVHPVCLSAQCPFQVADAAFPPPDQPLSLDEAVGDAFDEEHYLSAHPDVRQAVAIGHLTSGLEHFIRFGKSEGRAHRLLPPDASRQPTLGCPTPNQDPPAKRPATHLLAAFKAQLQGRTVVENPPIEVSIAVTNSCNLKCVMCPQGRDLVANQNHLPQPIANAIIPVINRARRVILSGIGEPLLAPTFSFLLDALDKSTGQFSRAHSNGLLMTPALADKILDSGLKELSFSLDAAREDTYRRIRGASFDKALDGVRSLVVARTRRRESPLRIYINLILMRENQDEVEDFVALGKRLGVDAVAFSQLFGFGDTPSWVVQRGHWQFRYSEQMLSRDKYHLRTAVKRAVAAGIREQVPVILLSGLPPHA